MVASVSIGDNYIPGSTIPHEVASVSRDVNFRVSGFAGSMQMEIRTQPKSESNLCPLVIAPAMGGQLMAKGVRETQSWPRRLMLFFLFQLMVFGIGGHGCLFCRTIATAFANTNFYIYIYRYIR